MPSPPYGPPNAFTPQVFGGRFVDENVQFVQGDANYGSWAATQIGANTLQLNEVIVWEPANFNFIDIMVSNSYSATNAGSSRADTVSFSAGFYAPVGSSLTLVTSASFTTAFTVTGSSSSLSYQGLKALGLTADWNIYPGNYWLGVISAVSTAGNAIAGALSNVVVSYAGGLSAYQGRFGSGTANSDQPMFGFGILSVTTASLPGAIAVSDISGRAIGNTNKLVVNYRNYTV